MDIKFEVIKKISEASFRYHSIKNLSNLESVSPPSVFIGSRLRYPFVNVGIVSPIEGDKDAWIYDAPKTWANNNFSISNVLGLRNNLVNSRFLTRVKGNLKDKKFLGLAKEIAISSKPVDVEIELKRGLSLGLKKDKILTGFGVRAPLKKARITGNVSVEKKLDRLINDDVKANEGLVELYKNRFDGYSLSKILSVGVLGLKKNRKIVPTRWSITATDDTLGKQLIKEIKDFKIISDYELFFGEFLGNQYLILLFPRIWSFELFEIYLPKSSWNPSDVIKASTDYENYYGRKTYAEATAGGYYATRLPILEYLKSIKRQASVFVIRLETPSYWAGLGVWVVRESVRKALNKGSMKFDSRDELIESAKKISNLKYNFNPEQIIQRSKLINQIKSERSLNEWLN